ncbi:AAA family ATPase [Phyllobacterium sp. SB3]|uniref:AAA family ATPase n=1 Tax=Phyllobacterium sp. SB3 TaxID=3156073 RepID=UPI0032AE96E9
MLNTELGPTGLPVVKGVHIEPFNAANQQRQKKPSASFNLTNTSTIMETKFRPIQWVVSDYLTEGFSVLAGRQKLGKTWLAIDWAIAVATGGYAMGSVRCEQGDVLYIDLENGQRRIQRRIDALFPDPRSRPDLSQLNWVTEAPMLDAGFIDALENWRSSVTAPRFVIIDVLQRIKPAGNPGRNSYENDYSIFAGLQKWATQKGICVLALHHTRKGGADDPLEALSGSNGLSACADATLVLDRDENGITLYVRGRDIEEKESALKFNSGIWNLVGDASAFKRTNERESILAALLDADEPMSPKDISIATAMSRNNIDQLLHKMSKAGELQKHGRGRYVHPGRADLIKGGSDAR